MQLSKVGGIVDTEINGRISSTIANTLEDNLTEALWDTNLSLVDSPEDWIKTTNLLLEWNCALIQMLQFLSEIRDKLNADIRHQHNNLEQVSSWSINNKEREKKKKKTQSEKTSETLVSSNSGCLPGGAQLTHAGSREAREMLGLGTQALKPWGLKHQAADNDVLYQSLFSKPITEVGAQEKWLYHPCLSGRSPFLVSQSPRTQTDNALRTTANVMHKAMQFKKLCISVERWSPRRRILIASINQSIYWHIKPTSTKCWELQSCIKYIRKLVMSF